MSIMLNMGKKYGRYSNREQKRLQNTQLTNFMNHLHIRHHGNERFTCPRAGICPPEPPPTVFWAESGFWNVWRFEMEIYMKRKGRRPDDAWYQPGVYMPWIHGVFGVLVYRPDPHWAILIKYASTFSLIYVLKRFIPPLHWINHKYFLLNPSTRKR